MKYDDSLGSIFHIGVSFGKDQVGGDPTGLTVGLHLMSWKLLERIF